MPHGARAARGLARLALLRRLLPWLLVATGRLTVTTLAAAPLLRLAVRSVAAIHARHAVAVVLLLLLLLTIRTLRLLLAPARMLAFAAALLVA